MTETYHIRIKKEYAAAVIEDLRKNDAVEFLPEESDVPQWQQDIVLGRIARYKNNPELYIDEASFFEMLNED